MSNDRPITPEQALLAVKAAGFDPDKPLSEQLNDEAAAGSHPSESPQPHELLAQQLDAASSKWHTIGGAPGDGPPAA